MMMSKRATMPLRIAWKMAAIAWTMPMRQLPIAARIFLICFGG
jgi:hypothetical protein